MKESKILIFKGHPERFPTQVGDTVDFDNVETYMEIPFEFYLDMPEEEKAFVQGFNYYIDENLKDARRELAKAASKIPEAKYMLALVNYLLGKKTEAKILLTNFSSDWKRFIQTWRIPILVVPFQSSDKNLYISIDEKGLNALNYLLEGKTAEEIAFILGL
ncbi:hypothetical protein JCM14244_08710 [Venenivibrio stagnispumantis]|uniref:Uncharacterized protein n=1 Tax=Venenivibrio stagnispumantis TaxID=407998 RepID=A0AA46AEC7_9AQUI|nr:hypothetical protein [Venenivibrio stagnispumantis]MCW4573429.1 hypothetical protein [Venenivibrio stagnispumantis]SMP12007.1 hypothetical protein SAMN06264868_10929 [Venenivibrio stagnispumantis]